MKENDEINRKKNNKLDHYHNVNWKVERDNKLWNKLKKYILKSLKEERSIQRELMIEW